MRAARDVDEFVAAPVGRYLVGARFLCWCRDASLFGCIYRGSIDRADAEIVVRMLEAELHPDVALHASLADLRRMESATPGAFDVLATYLAARRDALAGRIRRQAILRPAGMLGSVVAGFYEVHAAPYPTRTFGEPEDALAWLGVDAGLLAALDALHDRVTPPDLLLALQRTLRVSLPHPSITDVARALGLSTRTLQRKLGAAGTSYQAELARARIDEAKARMRGSDVSLTAVALDVGCASLQHFSVLFRKLTGEPPSAWRARGGD